MIYYLILKNETPEKLIASLDEKKIKNEDVAFWLMSHQVLNIYDDKEIAEQCMSGLSKQSPNLTFKMVELHQIDNIQEWN